MPTVRQRKHLRKGEIINGSRQLAIIKGDEKSFSIASASIIAKVYRDKLMVKMSKNMKYRGYAWDKNKGYGTEEHRIKCREFGLSSFHRKYFCGNLS